MDLGIDEKGEKQLLRAMDVINDYLGGMDQIAMGADFTFVVSITLAKLIEERNEAKDDGK